MSRYSNVSTRSSSQVLMFLSVCVPAPATKQITERASETHKKMLKNVSFLLPM